MHAYIQIVPYIKIKKNKCVSKTDTNPPFAFK